MRGHIVLATARGRFDRAGPPDCSLGAADDWDRWAGRLGPDPLRRDASPERAIARMRVSAQPIGALLLDQKVLAGVGNVFRAEALFVNGLHPSRPGRECSEEDLRGLWQTIAAMLRQGVKDNRIVTIDRPRFPLPKGTARLGATTYVYHRDLCLLCGTSVCTVKLAGRDCYFCPTCQPT